MRWTGVFPPLHLVTDDTVLSRPDFGEVAASVLDAGGTAVALHLRGSGTPAARLYQLALWMVERAARAGALLLVNDRVDVALAGNCRGVQLAARSLSPNDARELLGPERLIGASVHSVAEAEAAGRSGADFLIAGSVYHTESHPGREPAGLDLLRALRAVPLPTIAIGGVTPARCAEVRAAGAVGVAVLRGVWGAASPPAAVDEYLRTLILG